MDERLMAELERVEAAFQTREAAVQAFIPEQGRFERLRKEAAGLAERFPIEAHRPVSFGLLVAVKDIFHVDGFATQAGSRLPHEALQGAEAASVSALRKAGALIVGKTVTTEFAYFAPGPTRNPRNLEHTPGGSSSGSAAAVAAGLCTLALGTQTIGSIVRPAAFCGVVGLKPTYDRISRAGVIPLSPSLDHVGCFSADVATARRAAPRLYVDWDERATQGRKPTLGVPEGAYLECTGEVTLRHFRETCASLERGGYSVHAVSLFDDYAAVRARHDLIMSAEAARVHARWFKQYEALYAAKTADLIRRGQQVSEDRLARALEERTAWREALNGTLQREGIDIWVSPSAPGTAPRGLESTGDPVMNLPWTQAGLPTVSLPAGVGDEGLPLGLQLTGRWGADEALLHWAQDLESVVSQA